VNLKRLSFGKNKRLVSSEQFKAVLSCNLRARNDLLTLYIAKNNCGYPRLGISVGKSYGKAVVRNRLKRLLRETFRQSQNQIPPAFDYVIMFSPRLAKKDQSGSSADTIKNLNIQKIKSSFLALVKNVQKK
jgi:ribonuclease P protein component